MGGKGQHGALAMVLVRIVAFPRSVMLSARAVSDQAPAGPARARRSRVGDPQFLPILSRVTLTGCSRGG
jgi:hypothetical protein